MLLLAADTSGKDGSIALARGHDNGTCEVIEVIPLAGGTFSAQLVPQIAALLAKHGFSKNDLGGFAVASGPGSFTGLRVGLAAIKAFAEVLHKPIAAVSLLEAIAVNSDRDGKVVAALDAGRGQLFVGEYKIGSEKVQCTGERLVNRTELMIASDAVLLSPDSSVVEAGRAAGAKAELVDRPRSDVIARIGWTKILAGDVVSPEVLDANYIRRSDAEIFSNKYAGPGSGKNETRRTG